MGAPTPLKAAAHRGQFAGPWLSCCPHPQPLSHRERGVVLVLRAPPLPDGEMGPGGEGTGFIADAAFGRHAAQNGTPRRGGASTVSPVPR
jgi:hypothetical protein